MTDPFLSAFDPGYGLREEFAALARQSGRLLNERAHAQVVGAENLLRKAIHALASGDAERAERLIHRVAQMPFDPREQASPGVAAAALIVDSTISDEFEAREENDTTWLDVALEVYPRLDPLGQAEVASVVHGFVLQDVIYTVSAVEHRRIRRAFGDAPLNADLGDVAEATVEQRAAIIRSLVVAARALEEAYAAAT